MKWDNRDFFKQFDIVTPETITDEEVRDKCMDKFVDLYVAVKMYQENGNTKLEEQEKIEKQDAYKDELYSKLKGYPSAEAKILVLQQFIRELGRTKQENVNIGFQLEKYIEMYEAIKDKESRRQYIRSKLGKKVIEYELMEHIAKNGGEPSQELKTKYVNAGSHPLQVQIRKDGIVPYDEKYHDDEMSLSIKKEILFVGDMSAKSVQEYLMILKGEDGARYPCTVQGTIVFPQLNQPNYRAMLLQAILQSRREGSTYFGSIQKEGEDYMIRKDTVEQLAIEEAEKIEEQARRQRMNQGEER